MSAFLELPVAFLFPLNEADDGVGCEASQIVPVEAPERSGMIPTAQDFLDHCFHGAIQSSGVCLIGGGRGRLWLSPDPRHQLAQAGLLPVLALPRAEAAALAVTVVPAPDMRSA